MDIRNVHRPLLMAQSISFQEFSLQRIIILSLRIRAYVHQRYEPARAKDKGTLEAFPFKDTRNFNVAQKIGNSW